MAQVNAYGHRLFLCFPNGRAHKVETIIFYRNDSVLGWNPRITTSYLWMTGSEMHNFNERQCPHHSDNPNRTAGTQKWANVGERTQHRPRLASRSTNLVSFNTFFSLLYLVLITNFPPVCNSSLKLYVQAPQGQKNYICFFFYNNMSLHVVINMVCLFI